MKYFQNNLLINEDNFFNEMIYFTDLFYNIMKNRFSDLKEKLERNLKDKETLKFECSKCKLILKLNTKLPFLIRSTCSLSLIIDIHPDKTV